MIQTTNILKALEPMNVDMVQSSMTGNRQHLDNGTVQAQPSCTSTLPLTMTVEETATALGLSKPVVYELTRQPDFPCFNVGKKILINRARLQDWIDQQCCKEVQ